ncbi:diguanylate cyclase domain-containing protein [Lichenicoccus sp.]|uniref:diguanylate cyclase domain-containing protein n=1 Tax=Lichenicoccus sp. TaxID=2781899 RepID=UPI003D0B1B85
MLKILFVSGSTRARDEFPRQAGAARSGLTVIVDDHLGELAGIDPEIAAVVLDSRNGREIADVALRRLTLQPAAVRPFVLLLIGGHESEKEWAISSGADDVLAGSYSLPDLRLRLAGLCRAVGQQREIDRLSRTVEGVASEASQLRSLAYTDHLTGLPNRLYLDNWVSELGTRRDGEANFGIHMIDLDKFKQINDRYGHRAGDILLKQVSERLCQNSRRLDIVARLGGDEIAVVQVGAISADDLRAFAERLLTVFKDEFVIDGNSIQMAGCVGSALYPAHSDNFSDLLHRADIAMYEAKSAGTGIFRLFQGSLEPPAPAAPSEAVERQLREVRYGLFFSLAGSAFRGGAVAVRARRQRDARHEGEHDEVSLAERVEGQLRDLRLALLQSSLWKQTTYPVVFSASVHASAFTDRGIVTSIHDLLLEVGADPAQCEVTLEEPDSLAEVESLHRLRELGMGLGAHIRIETFMLQRMLRLPLTRLHLDRGFTETTAQAGNSDVLVEAAVLFARSIRARTVAYGVTAREQAEALLALGVDDMTGPYAAPVASNDALASRRQRIAAEQR